MLSYNSFDNTATEVDAITGVHGEQQDEFGGEEQVVVALRRSRTGRSDSRGPASGHGLDAPESYRVVDRELLKNSDWVVGGQHGGSGTNL
ncbi:hypothetical protein [Nocardia salmonicida]|uniref:hypothetical protein n=1 Tax=Nocardia salmonicida TaxID=53431 RepID=UPI0033C45BBB